MKKWMYLISVSALLAIFLVFYFADKKAIAERERVIAEKVAHDQQIEDARRAEVESKARADAEKRAADRAAEDAKKDADRLAKWEEEGRKIQEATDKYNAEANANSKKAADLEVQLAALRATKEKVNREAFELSKQVEAGKIVRRTAEMQIQRAVEMISRKAADSTLARPPTMVSLPSS